MCVFVAPLLAWHLRSARRMLHRKRLTGRKALTWLGVTRMNRLVRCLTLTVFSALMASPSALAWNKAGHMVTGAIAYQVLKQDRDDKTIARVVALLHQHPEFARW